MRGGLQTALKRLVQSEAELIALSERLVSSALASTSAPSVGAITAQLRNEPALQRLAPRLFSTLAAGKRGGCGRYGGTVGARLAQQLEGTQQVRWAPLRYQCLKAARMQVFLAQGRQGCFRPHCVITSPSADQPPLALGP